MVESFPCMISILCKKTDFKIYIFYLFLEKEEERAGEKY